MSMNRSTTLNLDELDNYISGKCGGKELYFGCWSPEEHDFNVSGKQACYQVEKGKNWLALRNGADQIDGLLFPKTTDADPELIIFRGYLSESALHSYSNPKRVKEYWSDDLQKRHNGIFSAVRISQGGSELNIITDIFCLGAIYIRRIGDVVFFSSTPALLSIETDIPNKSSWFMRLMNGFIPGRETLIEEIELAPEASITTYTTHGQKSRKWFDYSNLPEGGEPVKDESFILSEQFFSSAMKRCQNVHFGDIILPLSSGYDSRRIFAHLEENKTLFQTCTVQTLLESGEDVEADCATQITHDFNIRHKLLKYPSPHQWHEDDIQRIFSMDGQCHDHTWSVPLFTHYHKTACCIYDGIGGDVFGFHSQKFKNHVEKIIPHEMPRVLNKALFPDFRTIREKFVKLKGERRDDYNQGILNFVLWQTRKSSSTWSQQQAKPGHIILCPYFDLDYIETMLRFSVKDSEEDRPQKVILYKFWPKLASYAGTREMPKSVKNILDKRKQNNKYSLKRLIAKALKSKRTAQNTYYFFTFPARCALFLSQYIYLNSLPSWWLKSAAELLLWWSARPNIIEINHTRDVD